MWSCGRVFPQRATPLGAPALRASGLAGFRRVAAGAAVTTRPVPARAAGFGWVGDTIHTGGHTRVQPAKTANSPELCSGSVRECTLSLAAPCAWAYVRSPLYDSMASHNSGQCMRSRYMRTRRLARGDAVKGELHRNRREQPAVEWVSSTRLSAVGAGIAWPHEVALEMPTGRSRRT